MFGKTTEQKGEKKQHQKFTLTIELANSGAQRRSSMWQNPRGTVLSSQASKIGGGEGQKWTTFLDESKRKNLKFM